MYQKKIKITNEKKIFSFIYNTIDNFTVLEIVDELEISFPTVKRALNYFIEKKIIIEKDKVRVNGGRKSLTYAFQPNSYYSIGMKISYSTISIVLSNLRGEFLKKENYNFNIEYEKSIDYILECLEQFFDTIDAEKLRMTLGIGISIPGIFIPEKGVVELIEDVNIPYEKFDLISKKLNLPIYIENESNLSSISEAFLNKHHNLAASSLNIFSINENVGLSVFYQELESSNFHFKAGKINHMIVADVNGKLCSCGQSGCLGLYISDNSLIEEFKEVYSEVNTYSDIFSKEYYRTKKGKEIFDRYIFYLSIGVKNLINYSNPESIVICGQICKYKYLIEEPLNSLVYSTGRFYHTKSIIEFSKFNEDSSLVGASLFPIVDIMF